MALYQPSAQDLHFILAAIRMYQNLQLIGEELQQIAKSLLEANQSIAPAWYHQLQITEMTDVVYEMYTGIISAFIQRSPHIAHAVYMRNHEVDTFKWAGNRLLIDAIKANPLHVEDLLSLIFTLQRIGTLADNICIIAQEIVFFVEGKSIRRKESNS